MVGWHHRLNGHGLSKLQAIVKDREAWGAVVHGVEKSWTRMSEQQQNLFHTKPLWFRVSLAQSWPIRALGPLATGIGSGMWVGLILDQ